MNESIPPARSLAFAIERLARQQCPEAWAALLVGAGPALHRLAARMTGDPSAADDALQETLLRVRDSAASFPTGRGDADAMRWMLTIAARVCLNQLRARKRTQRMSANGDETEPADRQAPSAAIERRETAVLVRAALAELPEATRLPIVLHLVGGLTFADVASQLGVPEGTAKVRVHRGLGVLRRRLGRVGQALSIAAIAALLSDLPACESTFEPRRWEPLLTDAQSAPAWAPIQGSPMSATTILTTAILTAAATSLIWSATGRPAAAPPGAAPPAHAPVTAADATVSARATGPADLPAVRALLLDAYRKRDVRVSGSGLTTMDGHSCLETFSCETQGEEYRFSWRDDGRVDEGSVMLNRTGGTLAFDGRPAQWNADPDMVIAGATGISGSSATLMYHLWRGDLDGILPDRDVAITQRDAETVVDGSNGLGWKLTVVLRDGRLARVRRETPAEEAEPAAPHQSDDDIRKTLRSIGSATSPADIATMREAMETPMPAHGPMVHEFTFDAQAQPAAAPAHADADADGPTDDG